MREEILAPREALERGSRLPYALVRRLSGASLGPTPGEIPAEELLEARFFSDREEIRVFRYGGALRAAALADDAGDRYADRTYPIANRAFGAEITVRTYLDFDGDGQAYWSAQRLVAWKGAESHG